MDLLAGERVLGFDVETTGLSSRRDRVVQYALVGSDATGEAIQIERLVNPGVRIPPETTRVHGISDADVADEPSWSHWADEVHDLMDGAVLVGHNIIGFDWGFVETEFRRVGRPAPRPKALLDTLHLARRLKVGRPHKLGDLCAAHGIRLERAHTAAADSAATLLLLWRFMRDHPSAFRRPLDDLVAWQSSRASASRPRAEGDLGPSLDDLEAVDESGKLRRSGEDLILAFGKHRGASIAQVRREDPRYTGWLLGGRSGLTGDARQALRDHLDELKAKDE